MGHDVRDRIAAARECHCLAGPNRRHDVAGAIPELPDAPSRPKRTVRSSSMRLIVARCEVVYSGRLHAYLPESTRLLMLKGDGSVLVHADAGGFKPLNWS